MVVGVVAIPAFYWGYINFIPAFEHDGFFGALVIVLASTAVVALFAMVGFLMKEMFSELESERKQMEAANRPKTS